jgi:transcriptional regulator with XRE-family HTH domain
MKRFSFKGMTERTFGRVGSAKSKERFAQAVSSSVARTVNGPASNGNAGVIGNAGDERDETPNSGPISIGPASSGVPSSMRERSASLVLREAGKESVGRGLRRAREGRGMSLAELSTLTRIPAATLRAIERDHFDGLPGEVFVRGFLRSIAKAVGLSADAVVAKYTQSRRLDLVATTPISSFNAERAKSESRRFGVGVVCVLLVLLLALAVSIVLRPRGREMPQELSQNESSISAALPAQRT